MEATAGGRPDPPDVAILELGVRMSIRSPEPPSWETILSILGSARPGVTTFLLPTTLQERDVLSSFRHGDGAHGDVWVACLGGMFGWLGQAICQIFSEAEAKIARLHPARCRNRVLSVSLSPGQICGKKIPRWTGQLRATTTPRTKVSDDTVTTETRAQRERERPC